MLFSQIQILLMIFIYLFCLHVVRSLIIEVREMELLSLKDGGQIWASLYNNMPLASVQAITISFSVVQILMMMTIVGYMFRFAQNGI